MASPATLSATRRTSADIRNGRRPEDLDAPCVVPRRSLRPWTEWSPVSGRPTLWADGPWRHRAAALRYLPPVFGYAPSGHRTPVQASAYEGPHGRQDQGLHGFLRGSARRGSKAAAVPGVALQGHEGAAGCSHQHSLKDEVPAREGPPENLLQRKGRSLSAGRAPPDADGGARRRAPLLFPMHSRSRQEVA